MYSRRVKDIDGGNFQKDSGSACTDCKYMDFSQSKILTASILYDLRSTVTSAAAMGEDDAFAHSKTNNEESLSFPC